MKRISLFTLLLFLCCGLQAGFAQKKQNDSNRKSEERRQNDRWDREDEDERNGRKDKDDRNGREDKEDRKGPKNDRNNDRWDRDDEADLDRDELDEEDEPDEQDEPGREFANAQDSSDPEIQAAQRTSELAAEYGIRDEKQQKKLQLACSKYYKAKALLARDFPQKNHRDRKKREENLEQEYSRELREILPQS